MPRRVLAAAAQPLSALYDLAMLDLDGVVYIGGDPVSGAAARLAQVREEGMRVAFITNNAARPPAEVAAHLSELGVPATAGDIVTSAQAAARVLLERFGPGAKVACVGGAGLEWALADAGLTVVAPQDGAVAIATGYGPDVPWRRIMQAAVAIREGLPWVASNADATIPTRFGIAPGHGAQVDLIARFAAVEPTVAGKPQRPLLDETVRRVGGRRPLMVGDRLDTDIEGGHNADVDSLLVLTGVTGLAEIASAPRSQRPTYLSRDLGGLSTEHRSPTGNGGEWSVGGWTAAAAAGRLEITGEGDGDDWWRAAAAACWSHADETGEILDVDAVVIPEAAAITR